MVRVFLLLIAATLAAWYPAVGSDLEQLHSATARLRAADGGTGTGTAFDVSNGYVFLVTCAHVATGDSMQVEWFYRGHQSKALPGRVLWRDGNADVAVVMVPVSALGGVVPPVIPLAKPDYVVEPNASVYTVGSANGVWPTGFEGHARGYDQMGLTFTPPPQNGRSGSAMIDESGQIVGVVRARSESQSGSYGIATPVQALYALWGNKTQKTVATSVQVPWYPATQVQQRFRYQLPLPGVQRRQYFDGLQDGAQCGPGGCTPQSNPLDGALNGALGNNIWPTMPNTPQGSVVPQQQAPGGNVMDLAPLAGAMIDPIVDAIRGPPEEQALRRRALEAQAEYYERESRQAESAEHGRIIDSVPNEAPQAIGQAVTGDFSGALDTATSDPMLGWLGQIIVWVLTGIVGITGIPALAIRFGVPFGVRLIGKRLKAAFHTEADDVADEIADRTAKKLAANGKK